MSSSLSARAAVSARQPPIAWRRKGACRFVGLNADAAQATADELTDKYGMGIGVAGTGISRCGPAIGLKDITNRDSVRAMLEQVICGYGGIDNVIVTAGVFVPAEQSGQGDRCTVGI